MSKRAYFNATTKDLKYFSRGQALLLSKDWQMVPDMQSFINDDGKHQVRLHFPDFTVDLIETDEIMEIDAINGTRLSDVEVIADGKPSAN